MLTLVPLAYLAAQTYGLHDEAGLILQAAGLEHPPTILPNAALTRAPLAVMRRPENWPLLNVSKNLFESAGVQDANPITSVPLNDADLENVGDWGDEDLGLESESKKALTPSEPELDSEEGDGWGDDDDDLEIPELSPVKTEAFVLPKHGVPVSQSWKKSKLAADHVAAGSFETAMKLLNTQIGAINFEPLKPHFMAVSQACHSYIPGTPLCPPTVAPLLRSSNEKETRPRIVYNIESLIAQLQAAYPIMTAGKFSEAVIAFRQIIHESMLTVVGNEQEAHEVITIN